MPAKLEHSHEPDAIRERLAEGAKAGYVRDWIYGAIDGAVTVSAVISGVRGAELSTAVVLVVGLANLLADGFAMGAGNYIATKSERDDYQRLLAIERRHIALVPDGEREEVRQIFARKGFDEADLDRIVAVIAADESRWAETMAMEEYGASPASKSPVRAGIVTFAAFVLAGMVPLATYLAAPSFSACAIATGWLFFAIGAVRSLWSPTSWGRSGLETCVIGMCAAGLAFLVGYGLRIALALPPG